MEFFFKSIAGHLPEDGGNIIVELLHHDSKPQFIISRPEYLFKHKIFHEGTCNFCRGEGGSKIKGILFFSHDLVIDSMSQFVRQRQDVIKVVSMIQEDIGRLRNKVMSTEGTACLAFFWIYIKLAIFPKPAKDGRKLTVKVF